MADYLTETYLTDDYLNATAGGAPMADYAGAKPIRTERDNETRIQLVSGTSGSTATEILSIAAEGTAINAGTNDYGIPVFGKDVSGNYKLLDFTANGLQVDPGTVTVEATDLDIRDLDSATDSVAAVQSGVWSIQVTDGTETLLVNADGSINAVVTATDLDIRDLDSATDSVTVVQGTDPWNVAATDLDIRDLTHASDSIKVGDGTEFLSIATDGQAEVTVTDAQASVGATAPLEAVQVGAQDPSGNVSALQTDSAGALKVVLVEDAGETDVLDYQTTAAVVKDADATHDYLVTSGKTFDRASLLVGSEGRVKVQLGTWDGVSTFTPKAVYFQDPTENRQFQFPALSLLGDGTVTIRVIITNLDGGATDLYSTLQGVEE
jgi:hypothetical protein